MLPTRYWRDGPEFWLAYWYHDLGEEGMDLPLEVTPDWWEGRVRVHVKSLSHHVSLYKPVDIPWESRHRKLLEDACENWTRIGYECPISLVVTPNLTYNDLLAEYAPSLKWIARAAIMVKESPRWGIKDWPKADRKRFNQTATAIGYEGKCWNDDARSRREANGLNAMRFQIEYSYKLDDLFKLDNPALA